MTGEAPLDEPETANGASPFAWFMIFLCQLFGLIVANAYMFFVKVTWHASRTYDPSRGMTHLLNNHGFRSWIRPHDFTAYVHGVQVGLGGMILSILATLLLVRASTIGCLTRKTSVRVTPVVLIVASALFWLRRG